MAGYTRQDTANNIANGNVIDADDFDAEYNAIESGFNASTGHKHDGSAGEGAPITKVGPSQDLTVSPSNVLPKTTNTLDLGSNAAKFKDGYFDGTVVTDALTVTAGSTLSGNVTVGGTLGVTGATTLSSTAAITGNTTVGGTLGVTGASTLDSAAVTNNATVGGTLGVTGNTTVGGTLGVTGASTLDSAAVTNNATVGGTLGVTGNSTFSGTLGITSNTTVGGDLDITGNTTLGGTLGITGATTFSGGVNVGSDTIEEYVQDTVGGMVAGNTETGLSVTYDDTNGKLDFALTKDPVITLTGDVTGTGTMTNLGDVSIATTVAANQVALGTDTTGNYVAGVTAGTGVSISGTAGEGWSPTIAIGQAVGTTSNVTFNTVTASLTGNASSASTAAALTGDVTRSGDFTVDASGNIVLDADNNGGISNFQFKNGTGGGTFNMAFDNSENMTFSGAQAFSISSGQDLILDANGGQIYFRSGNVTRGFLDVQTANTLDFHAGSNVTEDLKITTSGVNVVQGLRVGDTTAPTDNDIYAVADIEAGTDVKAGGTVKLTAGASDWSFEVDGSNNLIIKYGTNILFKLTTAGALTVDDNVTAYGNL
jgi:hypothetical protein